MENFIFSLLVLSFVDQLELNTWLVSNILGNNLLSNVSAEAKGTFLASLLSTFRQVGFLVG